MGLALGVAEGQIDLPRILRPAPPPDQPIYSLTAHPEIAAALERRRPAAELPGRRVGEQMRRRQQARERIIAQGGQAYPPDIHPTGRPGDVATAAADAACPWGRVVAVRDHGGVIFADLSDWSGTAQVLLDAGALGAAAMGRWRTDISLGDHAFLAAGTIGASRTGTRSLLAREFRLAAKALHPLPAAAPG